MSPLEYTTKRLIEYTKKRLRAFLEEIKYISTSEFPYPQSKAALSLIKIKFDNELPFLNQFDSTSDTGMVKHKCKLILENMADYILLLGFIIRSTNVRNAFEVFKPTLRLAEAILGPNTTTEKKTIHLILSSEWNYSPYVYFEIPALPGFALIGLPAPESSNPLLVPLYGHELGHLVWIKSKMEIEMRPKLIEKIVESIRNKWEKYTSLFPIEVKQEDIKTNMFAVQSWALAEKWGLKQVEETFADFVALYMFGASFLYAFAYLISPSPFRVRPLIYPNTKVRVRNLLRAADYFKVKIDDNYASLFEDSIEPPLTEPDMFRLSVADAALSGVVDDLITKVKNIVDSSSFKKSPDGEEVKIYERLKKVVPAEGCKTLPDILNAAWMAYNDPNLWKDIPQIIEKKDNVLKNLILKNIEVFEIEQLMGKLA